MSFQAASPDDRVDVINALGAAGFDPMELDSNELAKIHSRHMIGGRAPAVQTEEEGLFRFEFPERPGSLLRFLEHLPEGLNVSLFHYRSHGADVARVLVALQVPAKKRSELRDYLEFLATKGFMWREETQNEVYGRFFLEPVPANRSGRSRARQPPPLTLTGAPIAPPSRA